MKDLKDLKEGFDIYVFLIGLWFACGCLFVLRTISGSGLKRKSHLVQHVIYSIGSSMLIGWVAFEGFHYLSIPNGLAGALSGMCAYIGANTISGIVISYFKNKLGVSDDEDIGDSAGGR